MVSTRRKQAGASSGKTGAGKDAPKPAEPEDPEADEPSADDEQEPQEEPEPERGPRRDDEERGLVPPPLQMFALFIVPLVVLALWALFWK